MACQRSTEKLGLGNGVQQAPLSKYVLFTSLPQIQAAEGSYDLPPNPDLSHIQSLMEEDDEKDSFSCNELVTYHAKAFELAAILKEDSPALKVDFTFTTQYADRSSFTEECPSSLQVSGYQSHYTRSRMRQVYAGFTLSNRMEPPPQTFEIKLSWYLSPKLLDTALCRNASARLHLPTSTNVEGESGAGSGKVVHLSDGGRRTEEADGKEFSVFKRPKLERGAGSQASSITRDPCYYVDLNELLVSCSRAIINDDMKTAMKNLMEVKQSSSPSGNGAQRLAYYFAEALEARMAGTDLGNRYVNRATPEAILKAGCMYMTDSPFAKAFRFFVNRKILDVARDATIVHIMEFELTGTEYPSLFKALAARPGGPPQVRLIGGNVPNSSWVSKQNEVVLNILEQIGRQLAICAAAYGVPFHFTAWAGDTGAFPMQGYGSANRRSDEVLVVLSRYPMRYSYDDLLNPPEKRLEILKTLQALRPEAYIHGFATGSYNSPFFLHRFREALYHFHSHYDMLDTFVNRKYPGRMVFESEILGKAVGRIVACEDLNVVERVNKHNKWYADTKRAGLRQMRLGKEIKGEVQKILKSWHDDYVVDEDLNYLLMGWRGRILYAIGTWTGKSPSNLGVGNAC